MRQTPKAIVGCGGPIFGVVPRVKSRQTEIGYLVMLIAGCLGRIKHHFIHVCGEVFIGFGLQAIRDVIYERRSLMNFQEIERKMFWSQRKSLVEVSSPAGHRLAWKAGNQIEADVVEAGSTQTTKSGARVICTMGATKPGEFVIVESLCTKTRSIDTQTAKRRERFVRDRAGIHLHRYFPIRKKLQQLLYRI